MPVGNHYHLVLHTRQANLSRLMRHVNGVYTQAFNQRHALVGHLFQGRFNAILVAYRECGFTMTALAKDLGLSVSWVSRLIAAADRVAQGKSNF